MRRLRQEIEHDLNGGKGGELLDLSHLTDRELRLLENVTRRAIKQDVDLGEIEMSAEERAALERVWERN